MGDAVQNGKQKLKLYLRFPQRIATQEEVKKLHPGIVGVFFPRQKNRRWCIVTFSTVDVTQAARKILKNTKIGDKKLIVTPLLHREARRAKVPLRQVKKLALRPRNFQSRKKPSLKIAKAVHTDSLVDLLKKEEKP